MPVDKERQDYLDMRDQWARLRDCFEGRDAVVKAGAKYAPDLPGATPVANDNYRKRGNFYNAVQRTVAGLAGAIFQKAPEVDFPAALEDYLEDVTLTNVDFEMFAGQAGREVMLTGRYGVLVDYPEPTPGGERAANARPYVCGYRAEDIVNWRTERRGGAEVLTLIVLKETAEEPVAGDDFTTSCVPQFRVIQLVGEIATVQLYRQKGGAGRDAKEFVPYKGKTGLTRNGLPLAFIPFVFLGTSHSTPDVERPPLLDLADVNLAHWRNSVDHEYGLHLVALPTPWVAGSKMPSDQAGQAPAPVKFGPSVVWELEVQGKAGMLEFAGTGLGAIVAAMEAKVKQMAALGARLFEEPIRGDTATAVLIRHAGEHASLRTVASSIEQALTTVLQILAWWAGTDDAPGDVDANVELNKEYLDVKATAQEIQVALTALQAGSISFDTWWSLITTGGWGREGIDAATERLAIGKDKALAPEPALDPALSPGDQGEGGGPGGPGKPAGNPPGK